MRALEANVHNMDWMQNQNLTSIKPGILQLNNTGTQDFAGRVGLCPGETTNCKHDSLSHGVGSIGTTGGIEAEEGEMCEKLDTKKRARNNSE
jgi:hypothetical protein